MKPCFKLPLAGVSVAIGGTVPIMLYIAFGPSDGNPVGLGLLAWLSWLVGFVLFVVGLVGCIFRNK